MAQLFDTIRQLVAEEKYIVGDHASERLEERGSALPTGCLLTSPSKFTRTGARTVRLRDWRLLRRRSEFSFRAPSSEVIVNP